MDYSLPHSSIHGISLARILEWAAICFSTACILSQKKSCVSESLCVHMAHDISYCSQGPKCLKDTNDDVEACRALL